MSTSQAPKSAHSHDSERSNYQLLYGRFDHQVSGHDKLLSMEDGAVLVKPNNENERDFYEQSVLHPEFAAWMPKYYGSLQLQGVENNTGTERSMNDVIRDSIEKENANVSGVNEAICIENLIWRFRKPCMLDMKLGTQYWSEDAPEEKRQRLTERAMNSTSGSDALRLTGFQVYKKSTDSYEKYDRPYGYSLRSDTLLSGFENYFSAELPPEHRKLVIERFVRDLKAFLKVLENEELDMHGASLLFVYEGDPDAFVEALRQEQERIQYGKDEESDCDSERNGGNDDDGVSDDEDDEGSKHMEVTVLKMIDFAHTRFKPGTGCDKDCVLGVQNAIKFIQALLNE